MGLTFQIDLARSYFLLKIFRSFTQCSNCGAEVENRKNHLAWHQVLQGVSVSAPWPGQTTEKTDAWRATSYPRVTTWHPLQGGRVSGPEPKNSKPGRLYILSMRREHYSPSSKMPRLKKRLSTDTLNNMSDDIGWKNTHVTGIHELGPIWRSLGNN